MMVKKKRTQVVQIVRLKKDTTDTRQTNEIESYGRTPSWQHSFGRRRILGWKLKKWDGRYWSNVWSMSQEGTSAMCASLRNCTSWKTKTLGHWIREESLWTRADTVHDGSSWKSRTNDTWGHRVQWGGTERAKARTLQKPRETPVEGLTMSVKDWNSSSQR